MEVRRVCRVAWLRITKLACVLILLQGALSSHAHAASAVCAEVRIEIRQKVSLERQAFDAVMRIRNGLAVASVEQLSVDILFTDSAGNAVVASSDPHNVDASFFLRLDDLDGISAVDGTGTVAPETTASIRWLIIPAASAGGTTPLGEIYQVGARVQYRLSDEEKVVEVTPETITVKPQPKLALDYFLAGEVYSDDPFTPEIEPPVPFTLGVRVRNTGAGTGHKVRVESAQPEIIDNELGLLVGFNIVGGHVDDQPASASLMLDYGDISAGATRMGRWIMETTLSGQFISMDARYTHADTLGGALTSLIDGVPATYLLVRDVLVDLPGRDGVRDFLARDGDVLRVYESNGLDSDVDDVSADALLDVLASSSFTLTFPPTQGLAYVQVMDPTGGSASSLTVRKSTGEILPSENAWFSKSRGADLEWRYFLNVFDAEGHGSYTVLADTSPSEGVISGAVYADINGNGVRDSGEEGVDGVALLLTGESVIGSVQRSVLTQDGGVYRFGDLPSGSYTVAVGALAGHTNGAHQAGSAGGVVEGTQIHGIELDETAVGQGYLFAKISSDTARLADLEVIALEAPAEVKRDTPTSVVIRVRNAGPRATLARTNISIPEGLGIDHAEATGGSFDAATGAWSNGPMLPGDEQRLTLNGEFSNLGQQLIAAVIQVVDGVTEDPDHSNNSVSTAVLVNPSPVLSVNIVMPPVNDLLILASCPPVAAMGCLQERAARWQALFDHAGIRYRVVTDLTEFTSAFRSGEWPMVWIDGGVNSLGDTLVQELRESVRRDGTLLLSGRRDSGWEHFEVLTGAIYEGRLPADSRVVVVESSEYFDAGELSAQGDVSAYLQGNGRVLGRYSDGLGLSGAIVTQPEGALGTTIVFGFDPLLSFEKLASVAQPLEPLITAAAVENNGIALAGSALRFLITATREGEGGDAVTVTGTYPHTFVLLDSVPPAQGQQSLTSLSWTNRWSEKDSFESSYTGLAPSAAGTYRFNASAKWLDQHDEAYIELDIRDMLTQQVAATTTIDALDAWDDDDALLKQQAVDDLAEAIGQYAAGDQPGAVAALLSALQALDNMTETDASDAALEVSRLLFHMARQPAGDLDGSSAAR